MRLARVEHGHTWKQRAMLALFRAISGHRAPDILRTLLYRPEFFGRWANELTHRVLRGPSDWTVGERELFAAFISRLNQCPF